MAPSSSYRLRRSRAVVVAWAEPPLVVHVPSGAAASADEATLAILGAADAWVEAEHLLTALGDRFLRAEVGRAMLRLVDLGALVVEGADEAEGAFAERWPWGLGAAHFHFGIKNARYQQPAVVARWMEARVASTAQPPAWASNQGRSSIVALPDPGASPLLDLLARRRSDRGFDPAAPLPLEQLADCLFSGCGITAFAATPIPGEQELPLGVTPSGGARNPYEAFVAARHVAGLETGWYHYAGVDHDLGRLPGPLAPLSQYLGEQAWFDGAAALIVLVARFARSAFKYQHPGALRVVLLEAGHIAQNVLLVATAHGLAAAPTCALSDRAIEAALALDPIAEAAIYAIALGPRSGRPSEADLTTTRPNPRYRGRG